jgi:ribonuclease VapC
MIVDTSVLIAILLEEPGFETFARELDGAAVRRMAAPNLFEASMVMTHRKRERGVMLLDRLVEATRMEIVPFTADHAAVARDAFLRYGKGRHPAGLNFGDCIAYATARLEDMPLLFKGGDFRQTDIEAAA